MKNAFILLASVFILTSCAHFTGAQMSRVNLGMSKADVIHQLGEPKSVGGGRDVEILHYVEDKGWWQFDYYFVRIVEGKVESYGPESKDHPVNDTNPPLNTPK